VSVELVGIEPAVSQHLGQKLAEFGLLRTPPSIMATVDKSAGICARTCPANTVFSLFMGPWHTRHDV
jgi:hypothetical protein